MTTNTNQNDERGTCGTYSVAQWARRLGISRGLAYRLARDTGEIAGVPVIRVGNRMVLSRDRAESVLAGETGEASASPGREA